MKTVDRRIVRFVAAAVAAAMAAIYFLIGLGVLDVGGSAGDRVGLLIFGALAGGAFLLGAALLVAFDRRWLWITGALFQVFVYWAYFDVAKTRTPAFETWGITLRVIQLPLLAALVYLALRPAEPSVGPSAPSTPAAAGPTRRAG
jgi:hypothetical protein